MDYIITDDGVYCDDDGTRDQICDRPVELVDYSQLDAQFYLMWPADDYHHMAALPEAMLADDEATLARWAEGNGLPVRPGQHGRFNRFLREHLAAER